MDPELEKNEARGMILAALSRLHEEFLTKPPKTNILENWNEHRTIRETMKLVAEKFALLSDVDADLRKPRSTDFSAFNDWCSRSGIVADGIEVVPIEAIGGLGLKTTKPIDMGAIPIQVPGDKILSSDTARKSAMFKKAFEQDPILKSMDNIALALYLCSQRLSTDSKWKPYIDILPNQMDMPIFFSEEELLELKPSPIFEEALYFYRSIARQYCFFYMITSQNVQYDKIHKGRGHEVPPFYNTPFTPDNFTFDLYRWAVGCVSTRLNLIPSSLRKDENGEPKMIPALIPLLDMANHEFDYSSGGSSVHYSDDQDKAVIVAFRVFSSGEDFTIDYGRRSNGDHLLHNGFVPDEENLYDAYKLKIALPKSDKRFEEKLRLLRKLGFHGLTQPNVFFFDIHKAKEPFEPSLMTFASVFVSDKADEKKLEDPEVQAKAANFLKNRFDLLERAYGEIHDGSNSRTKLIEQLKRSERPILAGARQYCENLEKQLQ